MDALQNETFKIRPIRPDDPQDLDAVLAVYHACADFLALGPSTASMEVVLADLELSRQMGGLFCGIYSPPDGELAGVVDFALSGFEGDPQLAFIELLMIAPPHRSQGLGAAVVRVVEAAIRQDGRAREIRAGVQVNNPQAQRFWRGMGYETITGPEQQADGTVAYGLRKAL